MQWREIFKAIHTVAKEQGVIFLKSFFKKNHFQLFLDITYQSITKYILQFLNIKCAFSIAKYDYYQS